MYAVIRAGGKQYRVAPGDVIRVEKIAPGSGRDGDRVEFREVLAVSGEQGAIARPQAEARVTGQVVGEGRGEKVLVFHYKRKKQYKRLRGHRQPFTEVRITEIAFNGQKFTAPAEKRTSRGTPKAAEGGAAPPEATGGKKAGRKKAAAESGPAEGAEGGRRAAHAHGGSAKATGSKTKGGKPPAPRRKK